MNDAITSTAWRRTLSRLAILTLAGATALCADSRADTSGQARKLLNSQGCKACHALDGDGGNLAGDVTSMRRLSRADIKLQLISPTGTHGQGTIPDFRHLSAAEIEALVNFIQPNP